MTRYPLLLSRLLKVTPASHGDREALQESRELIEQGLDSMNQETTRDSGTTKLWRRISMINPPGYRRSDNPIDLLGSTTWGVRKMVLETLGWGKEAREEINFVLESRLMYTQPTETNWRNLFAVKMSPTHALLVTLGQNTVVGPQERDLVGLQFPRETGCKEAALILLKEKGMRYSPAREPLMLDKCVICWEHEWDDCFEVTEFSTKESYIFKVSPSDLSCHGCEKNCHGFIWKPTSKCPRIWAALEQHTDELCFCRGRIPVRPFTGSTTSSSTALVSGGGGGGEMVWPTS